MRKNRFIFFLLMQLGVLYTVWSCNNPQNEDGFSKTTVWTAGENNMECYRIPGIVVSTKGTVLAFAEERPVCGDEAPKSIVLKRSEDKGKTWSANIYIERCDGSYWKEHPDEVAPEDVADKQEVWTNIAPIVDKITGRIFFFYALSEGAVNGQNLQRYTKVFYKYSDDDGLSWSERLEITGVLNAKEDGSPNKDGNGNRITDVNGFPCDYLGRAFHMPGPGHGIQLTGGRLLLQVWNRTALGTLKNGAIPVEERKYGICTIYSDDHGKSWHYGSAFGHDGLNMNESRMAELPNGDVYINARYVNMNSGSPDNRRITAISHDKGKTWTDIHIDTNFPLTNPCDGGLVLFTNKDGEDILLYSKNEAPGRRENLVVRLSYDEGKSWPVVKIVDKGRALYSDLAVLPDHTFLLIYETGKNSPVYCARFTLQRVVE
mgnify:CR=1 FL=1